MSFPSDVLLPVNAKYFGFVETDYAFDPHWDLTWSFSYALTGIEHGICTFLCDNPSLSSPPGHYIGYGGLSASNFILGVALDSTGLFALSTNYSSGVPISQIKRNSLIIRDQSNDVIFNESLSTLDSTFRISTSSKEYKTIRIRYSNVGKKIYIDYKIGDTKYISLTSLDHVKLDTDMYENLYTGLSFSSPISSSSITPSKIWVKNFHIQGNIDTPTYETSSFIPLTADIITSYTTISGISANS
jgi:hypothetical protein